MIKECKTIAEYAIRKWMETEGFVLARFDLRINGNEGVITDINGETLHVTYDSKTKQVCTGD